MLVLSRRKNEKIVIGDDIVLTVLEVRGEQVQIGIQAPRSVPVHRHEVYESIREVNTEAARSDEDALDALRKLARGERDED